MKKTILSVTLLSFLVVSQAQAAVEIPVNVPDVSSTGLLLGIAIISGLAVKRFFARFK